MRRQIFISALLAGLCIASVRRVRADGDPRDRVHPGTAGLALPSSPAPEGPLRLALSGDLADHHGRSIAGQTLSLLRPTAVFLLGNDALPQTGDETDYADRIAQLRTDLAPAKPYPCVGEAGSPRTLAWYQHYVGPLYYSVDLGRVHVIVLDSEEAAGKNRTGLSQVQLAWLNDDLDRAFEGRMIGASTDPGGGRRTRDVLVVMHRALWEQPAGDGNWPAAERLLVNFNRRPVVSVEGMGDGSGSDMRAPRVVGVFAGTGPAGRSEYRWDGVRDGISFAVLGPATGASPVSGPMDRSLAWVTLDDGDAGAAMTVGLLALESGGVKGAQTVLPADVVTGDQRARAEAIERWITAARVTGTVGPSGGAVQFIPASPSPTPGQIALRLSQTPARQAQRPFLLPGPAGWALTPGRWTLDGGWRGLAAGEKTALAATVVYEGGLRDAAPPAVEAAVRWRDERGRWWEIRQAKEVTWRPGSPAGGE